MNLMQAWARREDPELLAESLEQPDTDDSDDAELWHESAEAAVDEVFQKLSKGARERVNRAGVEQDPDRGIIVHTSTSDGDPRPGEFNKALAAMKAKRDELGLGEFVVINRVMDDSLAARIKSDFMDRMVQYHPAVIFGDFETYANIWRGLAQVAIAGALAMSPSVKLPQRAQLLMPRPRRMDQDGNEPANLMEGVARRLDPRPLEELRIQPDGRELDPLSPEQIGRRLWSEMIVQRDRVNPRLWGWLSRVAQILQSAGSDTYGLEYFQGQARELAQMDAESGGALLPPRVRAVVKLIADPTVLVIGS